jgi:hypothetical protein
VLVALGLGLLACKPGHATLAQQQSGKAVRLEELAAEAPETRQAAVSQILEARRAQNQRIADLLGKVLALPDREGTARDLILLLGKLRAAEQVPLLVRSLTLQVFYRASKRPQTTEDLFPAVQALTDIGAPAIDPVLERLQHEDGVDLQRAGTAVLRGILGPARAKLVLDDLARSAKSNDVRQRLKKAVLVMHELP